MLLSQGPQRSRRPQLSVAIMERHVLEAIRDEFGGWVKQSRKAAVPQWNVNGHVALNILRIVQPFLVIERRKVLAQLLLNDPLICRKTHGVMGSKIRHNEQIFQQMRRRNNQRLDYPPEMNPSNPSEDDYAYLAGILDGEGHIKASTRRIEVFSTDPELPAWLKSRFGGNVYLGHEAKGNQRRTWRWQRSPTNCEWIAGVASHMLLRRKSDELLAMEDFTRTPFPGAPTVNLSAGRRYLELVGEGVLPTVAAREAGLPQHQRYLIGSTEDGSLGLLE